MVDYNSTETLKRLDIIEASIEITKKFRTKYISEFKMIRAVAKENLIKKSALNFIYKITTN